MVTICGAQGCYAYQVLSKKFTSIISFDLFNNPIRKGQLCPFSDNKSEAEWKLDCTSYKASM